MKGPNTTGIHLHSPCLLLVAAVLVGLIAPRSLLAGGPAYVAGVTYFNSGMAGQIVSWPQGNITYYTDRGSLSSLLNSSAADAFVADAFSRWASVPTAALNITRGGQLAEDVSGANVVRNSDGHHGARRCASLRPRSSGWHCL